VRAGANVSAPVADVLSRPARQEDLLASRTRGDWLGGIDVALISLALIALVLRSLEPTRPLTGLVCLAAALLLPGAVIAHLLSLRDPVAWLAVCISASLAVVVLGSMLMLWSGAWYPNWLALLGWATSVTALAAHRLEYWGATSSDIPARP
jgi:hypothetical protein